ncbi:MAG TPA: type IV pilin protein [Burkholderiales bacterium]|nr:type IV pilin protein [Burkholderiales bacterium]
MQRQTGFTLIELMVTIAIIAILAAIAVPSYTVYITRSRIQEATTNLLAMRTKMEQYFQDNRSYLGGCAAGTVAAPPTALKYFTVSCPPANLTANTYTVQAVGSTPDLTGLTLSIDQANVRRTVSVPPGWNLPATNCWVSKKSGDC